MQYKMFSTNSIWLPQEPECIVQTLEELKLSMVNRIEVPEMAIVDGTEAFAQSLSIPAADVSAIGMVVNKHKRKSREAVDNMKLFLDLEDHISAACSKSVIQGVLRMEDESNGSAALMHSDYAKQLSRVNLADQTVIDISSDEEEEAKLAQGEDTETERQEMKNLQNQEEYLRKLQSVLMKASNNKKGYIMWLTDLSKDNMHYLTGIDPKPFNPAIILQRIDALTAAAALEADEDMIEETKTADGNANNRTSLFQRSQSQQGSNSSSNAALPAINANIKKIFSGAKHIVSVARSVLQQIKDGKITVSARGRDFSFKAPVLTPEELAFYEKRATIEGAIHDSVNAYAAATKWEPFPRQMLNSFDHEVLESRKAAQQALIDRATAVASILVRQGFDAGQTTEIMGRGHGNTIMTNANSSAGNNNNNNNSNNSLTAEQKAALAQRKKEDRAAKSKIAKVAAANKKKANKIVRLNDVAAQMFSNAELVSEALNISEISSSVPNVCAVNECGDPAIDQPCNECNSCSVLMYFCVMHKLHDAHKLHSNFFINNNSNNNNNNNSDNNTSAIESVEAAKSVVQTASKVAVTVALQEEAEAATKSAVASTTTVTISAVVAAASTAIQVDSTAATSVASTFTKTDTNIMDNTIIDTVGEVNLVTNCRDRKSVV